ncbi:MAG TPA: hypothetical protein VK504_22245 [Vicinamibacterales bacterium]|jgi:hypothetical protein|nr:hypothetical protein [Vicinamibacterales bacterium]
MSKFGRYLMLGLKYGLAALGAWLLIMLWLKRMGLYHPHWAN